MASPTDIAVERRRRALVLSLASAAVALGALVFVWARGASEGRAPAPGVREGPRAVSPVGIPRDLPAQEAEEGLRAAADAAGTAAPSGLAGLFLVGRVLDERGLPLADEVPRVTVESASGQHLAAPVDAAGGFGPLRLTPGTWTVSASAAGRRSATRTLSIGPGKAPAPLELTLPRVAELAVTLSAIGAGRDGDPARDLEHLRSLLSLHLAGAGEAEVERRRVEEGRTVFQPESTRGATLALYLGGERVLQQALAADQSEITLAVDPLDLWGRLVELEVELRDTRGAPLAGVTHALLSWESGTHLVAGQPGVDPSRARFEVCPPGAARLSVVDVDGRRASVDLVVPYVGPAVLEVELELIEPERR